MQTPLPILKNNQRYIRGQFLIPHPWKRTWTYFDDLLCITDSAGRIIAQHEMNTLSTEDHKNFPISREHCIWLPGFIDTHIHYPQTAIIGSASGPLLTWLNRSVFPEEAKFSQDAYATKIAKVFCNNLLQQGSTCAAIYSSSHHSSTQILFQQMAHYGLRGDVGLTLMDRAAPAENLCSAEQALASCQQLIDEWHGYDQGRLRFCVTPRFGISCSSPLLKGAGDLAQQHQLMIQTHISENPHELIATAEAFPNSTDYLAVYEDHGLLTNKSLFAHCIWLSDDEWQRMHRARAAVTHCPDSNFFLGSGQMPLQKIDEYQIRMGMGTDVGAGRSFSLRKTW